MTSDVEFGVQDNWNFGKNVFFVTFYAHCVTFYAHCVYIAMLALVSLHGSCKYLVQFFIKLRYDSGVETRMTFSAGREDPSSSGSQKFRVCVHVLQGWKVSSV